MAIRLEDKGAIEDWGGEAVEQNIEANHWFKPVGGLSRPYHGLDLGEDFLSNYPYPSPSPFPLPTPSDSSSDVIPTPAPSPSDNTSSPDVTEGKLTDSDYQDHYLAEQKFENNLFNLTKEATVLVDTIDSQIKHTTPSFLNLLLNTSNDIDDNNHREKENAYEQSFKTLTVEATRLVNSLLLFITNRA